MAQPQKVTHISFTHKQSENTKLSQYQGGHGSSCTSPSENKQTDKHKQRDIGLHHRKTKSCRGKKTNRTVSVPFQLHLKYSFSMICDTQTCVLHVCECCSLFICDTVLPVFAPCMYLDMDFKIHIKICIYFLELECCQMYFTSGFSLLICLGCCAIFILIFLIPYRRVSPDSIYQI